MKKSYTNIQDFLDDVHNELDLKEILIDIEIIDKKDFNGNFTNCVFHDGDNTPSLQVKILGTNVMDVEQKVICFLFFKIIIT